MRSIRVLLVDDEPPILHGLETHVPWRQLGFEVCATCTNGTDALSVLRAQPIDVVLSDIRMPGLDGLELCHIARTEFPDLVVLFLTAYRDFEFAQRAVSLGAWQFLLKPTNFETLYATLFELRRTLAARDEEGGSEPSDLAETISEWVRGHFNEASLERVADFVDLNPQYVSRRYFELTGTHFSELVQKVRMEHAARLLRTSRYRTYEISRIVGYSTPKNFARRFREYYGVSPSEYRRASPSS